jgi:hypothetical protein
LDNISALAFIALLDFIAGLVFVILFQAANNWYLKNIKQSSQRLRIPWSIKLLLALLWTIVGVILFFI